MRALAAWMVVASGVVPAQDSAPAAVRGRLVDERGAPIAGAAIVACRWNEFVDTQRLLAAPPAVSAADGIWQVLVEPNTSRVVIAAAGRQGCALTIGAIGGRDAGDLVLPRGARLVGRVRDENGAPLAGVRLRVESSIPQRGSGVRPQVFAGALSDAKGIFTVPCVPRNGLRLQAEADGYLTESRLVAQESPIDLALVKVGIVRGRVVDEAGEPVAGVRVQAIAADRTDNRSELSAADGTFALTVPTRGRFRIAASDPEPPHRRYSSKLLRGPADDVDVAPARAAGDTAPAIQVRVVDAATKQPVPRFAVSFLRTDPSNVQATLFHGRHRRVEYEGTARITLPQDRPPGLYVDAPGHGFEVVVTPEDGAAPLVVELGPEAVLRGRVLDAGTGKPMAGVAVRALPKGDTSGSGGRAQDAGPLSDANGEYVVRGLRPGEYGVQAHAEGRAASAVAPVTLAAGAATELELSVPKEHFVEVEITGAIPAGPAPTLHVRDGASSAGGSGFFQHTIVDPPPVPLLRTGRVRLGPLTLGTRPVQAFVPSRTRLGAGIAVELGHVDGAQAIATIALPDLTTMPVKGRIELPADVPSARVAVVATRCSDRDDRSNWWGRSVATTGLDGGARFELDLPAGSYVLQLADLATGIVFHTEPEDTVAGAAELVLKPQIHWLSVACEPAAEGADVVVHSFRVAVDSPRDHVGAFLTSWGSGNGRDNGSVAVRGGTGELRWLVPPGTIAIEAMQSFGMLRPGAASWSTESTASASADVVSGEHQVRLAIPAPPSDEELSRR